MIEQISLLLATPIAKVVLDKFYEGIGSKLGEKAVEILPEKVKQLGSLVWTKYLRGKPGADELLLQAANGSAKDQEKLQKYLNKVLDTDLPLREEVQKLAEEIHLEVHSNSGDMNQYNSGGTNFQNRVDGGVVNQAGSITQNYYNTTNH
ncbi:hypothetical protein [Leptolyngbya ohadii]|uniref:hypothetical protein n=1 Tax=Leptolyngbya ohadii TaxID=1962290 RepID=UPI000B59E1BC|nr:hypothetical protein [Leptolyngbya ohadii]